MNIKAEREHCNNQSESSEERFYWPSSELLRFQPC